jgi:hypothetical protein
MGYDHVFARTLRILLRTVRIFGPLQLSYPFWRNGLFRQVLALLLLMFHGMDSFDRRMFF